jgi:rfaE bifunctional protein kinase chain/domain
MSIKQHLLDVSSIVLDISQRVTATKRVVFLSGNFNIIHPGHLRLLNFAAECGDFLVVGVSKDGVSAVVIPEDLRLEGVQAIGVVNYAFILPVPAEEFIVALKPRVVIKGKEHEGQFNPELEAVESYGGKLLFSSGEVRFSSLNLLRHEIREFNPSSIYKPSDFLARHKFDCQDLVKVIDRFSSLRVVVMGDLIVDEYVTCDPLGMSQEDPTIVVTPIMRDLFVGGAAIAAAHARGLGAHVRYFGLAGTDQAASFAQQKLEHYGVDTYLVEDESRPTTLKQRYRVRDKTLLRVSHLRQHDMSFELISRILVEIDQALENADLVIFSDFNYGCLPQSLVDKVVEICAQRGIPMVADSQSSSQVGDISRFQGMMLIAPTEHEARLSVRDMGSGLAVLAGALHRKARTKHLYITLGSEGLLIQSEREATDSKLIADQLPAFNTAPKDVAGAGDCLLVCSSMALVTGASVWESAYLGSIAAACQVGRVGNLPLTSAEVIRELLA